MAMTVLQALMQKLWDDYAQINPQAQAIHRLLGARGETVVNDHIALRTFNDPRVDRPRLAKAFLDGGYVAKDSYTFPDKHLVAEHYEHPDPALPRVFISALELEKFSGRLRSIVDARLSQMPADLPEQWDFAVSGRRWALSFAEYEELRRESEYAAWMAVFGFRANHFTVLVNALRTFKSLEELNAFLKQNGYALNSAGGEIKGTPADLLEQSSTLASEVMVEFSDGPRSIPGCYYEFARRYPRPDGTLFGGFIARSADKIFESTNKR
jgi:hypothetical protein